MLENILSAVCSPALLYITFTVIYTSIDLYNSKYRWESTTKGAKGIVQHGARKSGR